MRESIDYKFVPPGSQEMSELQEFAASFDHQIAPNPNINVYAHTRGGRLFGYSDHVFIPTIYPAFHPEHTRPRDVIQVMQDWRSHVQLSGKAGYIGVPLPEDPHRANFPEETMNKLGLNRMMREIYAPF